MQNADEDAQPASRVMIRQLGPAHGGVVDGGISRSLAAMVFVGGLALWCVLMLAAARFRENWRSSAALYGDQSGEGEVADAADGADAAGRPGRD